MNASVWSIPLVHGIHFDQSLQGPGSPSDPGVEVFVDRRQGWAGKTVAEPLTAYEFKPLFI